MTLAVHGQGEPRGGRHIVAGGCLTAVCSRFGRSGAWLKEAAPDSVVLVGEYDELSTPSLVGRQKQGRLPRYG